MGLRIRTNIQSLVAQRNLGKSTVDIGKITNRLASGYRINRGGDDAAGFAISEALRADIRSLSQAKRNAADGMSLIEVAEGGLHEINNMLVRMRELAIQAASDTIGPKERGYLNNEFMNLKDEIDRIALSTEFNGTRLLTGEAELPEELAANHMKSPLEIQVGADFYQQTDSRESPQPINVIRIDLSRANTRTQGEGSLGLGNSQNEEGSSIVSKNKAQQAMSQIDFAMNKVSSYRADLGAIQNRLEKTGNALSVQIENLGTARSRIRDADFAAETANLAQARIIQQAGAAVLSQANQQNEIALKLLQ